MEVSFNCMDTFLSSYKSFGNVRYLYLNARSIRNKIEDIILIIQLIGGIDVIVIAETWLKRNEEAYFNINGYDSYSVSKANGTGGGVCIYVKKSWLSNINTIVEKMHSIVSIVISDGKNFKMEVIAVYNPNINNAHAFLDDLECLLANKISKYCIVVGDFNIDVLKKSLIYSDELSLMNSFNFTLRNNILPTRVASGSATLIDHIYMNSDEIECKIANIGCSLFDHNILVIDMDTKKPKMIPVQSTTTIDTKVNYFELNTIMRNNPFVVNGDEIDKVYDGLVKYIKTNIAKTVSKKLYTHSRMNSSKYPWLNKELQILILSKERLWSKCKRPYVNELTKVQYKVVCNQVTKLKRKAKAEYFTKRFNDEANFKNKWKLINNIVSNNKSDNKNTVKLNINNTLLTGDQENAEAFNQYFTNVAVELSYGIKKQSEKTATVIDENLNNPLTFLKSTNEIEVGQLIDNLKNKDSADSDGVSNILLKKCKSSLTKPIVEIINMSFKNGAFPNKLKIARVVPIHKSGDKSKPGNYRPISILSPISKIVEQVAKKRLLVFLNKNQYFFSHQYGFLEKNNTTNAAIDIVIKLQKALDDNQQAVGLFLDIKKAFDTVDHDLLQYKLRKAGIKDMALKWFQNYLMDRKQYVDLNKTFSSLKDICIGVPQGSVLGPILFLIFINDIGLLPLNGMPTLFADDTNIFYIGDDMIELQQIIQKDINILSRWFLINRLTVNIDKTNYIIFMKNKNVNPTNSFEIMYNNHQLKQETYIKYLGLIIDSNLSWENHINHIKKKITPVIGIMHRLKHCIPVVLNKSIYSAMVEAHMRYMCIIWGSCKKSLLAKIEVLQNRAIRTLYGYDYSTPTKIMYRKANVMPLKDLITYTTALQIYKKNSGLTYLHTMFDLNSDIHSYYTRGRNKIHEIQNNTRRFGSNGVKSILIRTFNKIPHNIFAEKSFAAVKKAIRNFVSSQTQ